MAKWISPAQRAAQEREREVARIVAQVRSEVNAVFDALVATWASELPRDWETQMYRAASTVVKPQIPAETPHKFLLASVMDALMAPRAQEMSQRQRREQVAREKAAAALVDTNRPIVATVHGAHKVGEPVILRELDKATQRTAERVLICIGSHYRPRDYEGNEDGGDYSDLAEPSDAERASDAFSAIQAQVNERHAYDQRQRQIIADRRQAKLDAIRAEGREPSFFEDMFAGTSDD